MFIFFGLTKKEFRIMAEKDMLLIIKSYKEKCIILFIQIEYLFLICISLKSKSQKPSRKKPRISKDTKKIMQHFFFKNKQIYKIEWMVAYNVFVFNFLCVCICEEGFLWEFLYYTKILMQDWLNWVGFSIMKLQFNNWHKVGKIYKNLRKLRCY